MNGHKKDDEGGVQSGRCGKDVNMFSLDTAKRGRRLWSGGVDLGPSKSQKIGPEAWILILMGLRLSYLVGSAVVILHEDVWDIEFGTNVHGIKDECQTFKPPVQSQM